MGVVSNEVAAPVIPQPTEEAAHDCGVLAGVSAHNPDCIKRVADEGWENDLFMCCFYYVTRPKEEQEKLLDQTRGLIDDIGLFDEELFGRGYGEENDYALRARNAGWSATPNARDRMN